MSKSILLLGKYQDGQQPAGIKFDFSFLAMVIL